MLFTHLVMTCSNPCYDINTDISFFNNSCTLSQTEYVSCTHGTT